jgi:alpha-D-xyloside xylohydrolase
MIPFIRPIGVLCCAMAFLLEPMFAHAQNSQVVLARDGRTIVLEPYAPNILRITLSKDKAAAAAAPGYGFIGTPSIAGWSHEQGADGSYLLRSSRLIVHVSADNLPQSDMPRPMPLDDLNLSLREPYFGGNNANRHKDDTVSVTTASGKSLIVMRNWFMMQNKADTTPASATNQNDPGYRVSAIFDSPADEHYYGLGQQQQGVLDLRDHRVNCWHDYGAIGGENVCVPFLVSSSGYGLIWDNPSKTTVDLGFNQRNVWSSEIGDRVSFFVILGDNSDEIYKGYRQLTGITPMLPKAAYGYIQSKAIYPTQDQIVDVAKEYRKRHLPLDVVVVDFLNMTKQGELDLEPSRWPDPAAMNKQLHSMGVGTLLSVWPHFSAPTTFYDMLLKKGWLIHTADGTPDVGGYKDTVGPNIDTTNPEAAKWWWEAIRDRYIKPYNFDYLWLDETEPDVDPAKDFFSIGSGARYYNVYPLFHTASVYEGFRRDFGDSRRVFILARAAYLGAQRNGTVFWSSDIQSTWDMLKRSVPAGLNFTATGLPYWDTDIAGFFSPSLPADYKPAHTPLIDPSDVRANIDRYDDYPELFVRWFQWAAFQPVMRAHGERSHNEVWSYGKQAEPILEKYLRLRYELLPYTYSLAYGSYKTGAPFMRALFMDFPNDPKVADIGDEYMFGPAFLVAPVTSQGQTSKSVYLPAGTAWYNYWTNQRFEGGQTIQVSAPIETIPLFVKAGSIVPLGSAIDSTRDKQSITHVKVYSGLSGDFSLYSDDGLTYAYENGTSQITHLHWDDAAKKLTQTGTPAWSGDNIVEVIPQK